MNVNVSLRTALVNAGIFAVSLATGGAVLMWLWNVLAHDLFSAPEAAFRHGLAAAIACLLLARRPGRLGRTGRDGHRRAASRP